MPYPWEEAGNATNPYDTTGFMYNLAATLSLRTTGTDIKNVLPVAATSLNNRYPDAGFDYQKFVDEFPWSTATMIRDDRDNNFQNVISGLEASEPAKEKISRLVDIINDFESQWSEYTDMKSAVENIETEIQTLYTNELISLNEYGKLCCMTSTVRFGAFL